MAKFILAVFALTSILVLNDAQSIRGHWEKTWNVESSAFRGATHGFAFTGLIDVDQALYWSNVRYPRLLGKKMITLGGGNLYGKWTEARLHQVMDAIDKNRFSRYEGIAFDVEEGDSGLSSLFDMAFQKARSRNFLVVVTIPYSAPYGFGDAYALTHSFIRSRHIDILSPMLYGSSSAYGYDGRLRTCNDEVYLSTETSRNVPWSAFKSSKAKIVPSIWNSRQYKAARRFFLRNGVTTKGFIAWCA